MARMPASEIAIDLKVVARLVRDQFPEFSRLPAHSMINGWDNDLLRLGDRFAVRLPRRSAAVKLIENEQRWLPGIAGRLTVDVPVPVATGVATEYYPWPWSIVPWIQGSSVADSAIAERTSLAADLGEFISELHAAAPADAPRNPVRGVPLADRNEMTVARLKSGSIPRSAELMVLWRKLREDAPWTADPVWLHGDLHPGNLVASAGRLSGVIDFGDLTAGDPATDLATAWLTFDSAGRKAFFGALPLAYRSDLAVLPRAKGWALSLATAFASLSDDNPLMAAIGDHAISQLLDSND